MEFLKVDLTFDGSESEGRLLRHVQSALDMQFLEAVGSLED